MTTNRTTWGGAREGAGRKTLPRRVKRSHRIGISVSPAEYEALERLAEGQPVSGYLYALALCAIGQRAAKA